MDLFSCQRLEIGSYNRHNNFKKSNEAARARKGRLPTELGHGGAERARDQLIERKLAQFLIEDFDAERAAVAGFPDVIEKSRDIKFAFTAESSVVDSVLDQVPGGGECSIVDFDAEEILHREARDFLVGDAEFHDVPEVKDDSAVFRGGALE